MVNNEKRNGNKNKVKEALRIVVGISVATTIGIATGILLAPKSGKETREDIKKKTVDTVEAVKDTVQKKVDSVKESVTQVA